MPQLLAPLIAAIGIPGLTAAGGGLTILGKILVAGLGIALSLGAELLLSSAQKRPKPQDVKTVVRSPVSSRVRVYGRGRLGGSLAFIHGNEGDLYQVVMFCQGPIDAVEGYIIDDRTVTLDGSGNVTGDPYNADSVQVVAKLGTATQVAFTELTTALPAIWTSDHRLRGIACALVIANAVEQDRFSKVYPNKWPVLNIIARGLSVFDPRDDSTAWSANIALQLRSYLTSADGARIPANLIDDDLLEIAADVCDENVTIKAGGTIKRYHGWLAYKLDEEPRDVIQRFLTAMDGRMFLTPEGKIGVQAGKWIAPTITLDDDHILDYDLEDGAGPHRRANEVTVKYTQVEANYSEATADPWRDEAAISADGIVRPLSPEVYEVQHHNHARRIAKILMERANPRWVGTIVTDLFGLECFDQRWITVQIADLEIDETFEVMAFRVDTARMTIILDVQAFSSTAYDFNAATEEGTAPKAPNAPGGSSGPVPNPAGVTVSEVDVDLSNLAIEDTVEPGNVVTNNYTVTGKGMRVDVTTPPKKSMRVQIQYEISGSDEWKPLEVDNESVNRFAITPPLSRGETYRARARYKSPGSASDWVMSSPLTIST